MDIEEIVRNRHSVRNYLDKEIENEKVDILKQEIDECNSLSKLNIQLVLNESNAFGKSHYGSFKNCKNYIVIIGKKAYKDLDEKAGYYGERIVLKAQEIGLNTCWVALTYNKSEVPCKLLDDEKITIVIALGYGETQGVNHKSKSYSGVSKVDENAPDWYKRGVEFALLAPTAINQQRFKFNLTDENKINVKAGIGPCVKIDIGIVKYHFELGAGKENFEWE